MIYTSTEDCYRGNRLPKGLSRKEKLIMTQNGRAMRRVPWARRRDHGGGGCARSANASSSCLLSLPTLSANAVEQRMPRRMPMRTFLLFVRRLVRVARVIVNVRLVRRFLLRVRLAHWPRLGVQAALFILVSKGAKKCDDVLLLFLRPAFSLSTTSSAHLRRSRGGS